jgi:hypothetical protein
MRSSVRARRAALYLSALLLCACAARAPRPEPTTAAAAATALPDAQARQLVHDWQRQLADYIATKGDGDPAVLARLPAQRSTGTLRPARISFGVLDVDARRAEADGFDVQGLLLATPHADGYVFMVGIVQRQGYRPQALVDLRPVMMQLQSAQIRWTVGDGDADALARYRAAIDPTVPLRFPADQDHFEVLPCAPGLCVTERLTQARWAVAH